MGWDVFFLSLITCSVKSALEITVNELCTSVSSRSITSGFFPWWRDKGEDCFLQKLIQVLLDTPLSVEESSGDDSFKEVYAAAAAALVFIDSQSFALASVLAVTASIRKTVLVLLDRLLPPLLSMCCLIWGRAIRLRWIREASRQTLDGSGLYQDEWAYLRHLQSLWKKELCF